MINDGANCWGRVSLNNKPINDNKSLNESVCFNSLIKNKNGEKRNQTTIYKFQNYSASSDSNSMWWIASIMTSHINRNIGTNNDSVVSAPRLENDDCPLIIN